MKLRLAMITATALVGLVAGCGNQGASGSGSEPAGAATTDPARQAATTPSCDLAPASLVNSLLGTNVGDPQVQDLHTVVVCRYSPTTGSGSVVLRMQTDMSRATFDQGRTTSDANGLPTADLPGFQDAAYTSVLSAGSHVTNTVVALKGTTQILVSSPAAFEAEQALESQLFGKLT